MAKPEDANIGSGGASKVAEAKQTRKSQLEAIFAQMPTNIKPKPGAKKVGDK